MKKEQPTIIKNSTKNKSGTMARTAKNDHTQKVSGGLGKQKEKPQTAIKKGGGKSGQVPPDNVRLSANIHQDLHLKLKIAAANRRTTIGELIEELVDRHLD